LNGKLKNNASMILQVTPMNIFGILRTYANQTVTYIENRSALPTMYDMVNRYPCPIKTSRYRNIQKYKNFIEDFTKYDKAIFYCHRIWIQN